MDGRAYVVPKTGQRQLFGARGAADGLFSFDDQDRAACLREGNGRGEAIRT
jgi:hypothetical protein